MKQKQKISRRGPVQFVVAAALIVAAGCSSASRSSTSTVVVPPAGVDADIEACRAGTLDRCLEVARVLDSPEADPTLRAKLAHEFNPGCERAVAEDCFRAALFADGPDTMLTLMERGCTGGVSLACRNLGETLSKHASSAEQLGQSVTFFTKACELGDAPSCLSLARTYDQGGPGLPRDVGQAQGFFKRGCENLHDAVACREGAELGCREGRLEDCAVKTSEPIAPGDRALN